MDSTLQNQGIYTTRVHCRPNTVNNRKFPFIPQSIPNNGELIRRLPPLFQQTTNKRCKFSSRPSRARRVPSRWNRHRQRQGQDPRQGGVRLSAVSFSIPPDQQRLIFAGSNWKMDAL